MKRIGIIPARGGSKRIPQKNIMDFNGKPMMVWTIEAALGCGIFDQVLVSTDSEEIAEVAISSGASAPFLRLENADDAASSSAATLSALRQAEIHWNTSYDVVAQLMPNCPLRNADHINDAVEHFGRGPTKFQISCFRFGWMNPWWAFSLNAELIPKQLFPDATAKRSQDLEHLYCPTGAIWLSQRDALIEAGTFYGPSHRFYPMDWIGAVDIDDMNDYGMALALAKMRQDDI